MARQDLTLSKKFIKSRLCERLNKVCNVRTWEPYCAVT